MKRMHFSLAASLSVSLSVSLLALYAALGGSAAQAQDISVSGTNTLRWERYDARGNLSASPYPFLGSTGYDEFAFNISGRVSPYDTWRALIAGVVNDSPYRSQERDLVPERLSVTRENGDAAIPYRAEAGDFFTFTSLRTQQRPLKGVSIEVQPISDNAARRHSLLFYGGAFQPNWRRFQWEDDNSVGLSWLVDDARLGRLNLNAMRNQRGANTLTGLSRRNQTVASIAAERSLTLEGLNLRIEGEVAYLNGAHDGIPPLNDGRDKSDSGAYLQVTGFHRNAINWRLRGERYGQDYRPFGAVTPPDRRSGEAHLGWSGSGLSVRARLQDYRDNFESANPLTTRVAGVGLSGSVAAIAASGALDAFVQTVENRATTIDQRTSNLNASLSRPFPGGWFGQASVLLQDVEDSTPTRNNPRTTQLQLSATHALSVAGLSGSIAPGVIYRNISGGLAPTRDWSATLALNLAGGPHRLALNIGGLEQNPRTSITPEIATVNFAADYRYRWGKNEFGVDITLFDRKPKPGEKTEAYRAGVQWTYFFERAPGVVTVSALAGAAAAGAASSSSSTPLARNAGLLRAAAPGVNLDTLLARMETAGLKGGLRQSGMVVFEERLLSEIEQRQRVVIVHEAGQVSRSALLISLGETGGADDPARVFERVRRALLDQYGTPATSFEEGAFGATFANELVAGRFIRTMEWRTEQGVIRLGIPKRLDGVARIEVQHARAFSSPRDSAWGIEALR